MKKIIASAVIAAATLSASQAAVFNGASAGLTLGTLITKYDAKLKANNTNVRLAKLSKALGSYGVHFDYDRSAANSFYWGLGLDFAMYSGKATKTIDDIKAKMSYSWSSEFDVRLGYNFCNNVAAYGLTGLRLYKKDFKMIDTDDNSTFFKKSKTRLAPVIGLGAKVKVSDKVSVGAEYRYAFERKETTALIGTGASIKETQRSHAVLAKVSYHF